MIKGPLTSLSPEEWRLVLDNRGLAYKYVRRLDLPSKHRDDALSAAMLGLAHAARNFDPGRGSFSTCAFFWMRRYLQVWRLGESVIRIPHDVLSGGRGSRHLFGYRDRALAMQRKGADVLPGIVAGPSEAMQTRIDVREAIGRLDDAERAMVVATMEGNCVRRAAAELGYHPVYAYQIRARAFAKLRETLKDYGEAS